MGDEDKSTEDSGGTSKNYAPGDDVSSGDGEHLETINEEKDNDEEELPAEGVTNNERKDEWATNPMETRNSFDENEYSNFAPEVTTQEICDELEDNCAVNKLKNANNKKKDILHNLNVKDNIRSFEVVQGLIDDDGGSRKREIIWYYDRTTRLCAKCNAALDPWTPYAIHHFLCDGTARGREGLGLLCDMGIAIDDQAMVASHKEFCAEYTGRLKTRDLRERADREEGDKGGNTFEGARE